MTLFPSHSQRQKSHQTEHVRLMPSCFPQTRRSPLWGFSIYSISCCNTKISCSAYCLADVGSSLPSEAKGRRWSEAEREADEEECVAVRTCLCVHDSEARDGKWPWRWQRGAVETTPPVNRKPTSLSVRTSWCSRTLASCQWTVPAGGSAVNTRGKFASF